MSRHQSQPAADTSLETLLGRDPVNLPLGAEAGHVRGRAVLVTGAGGSIGSELCRQLSRLGPELLVLVGNEENQLHELSLDLAEIPGAAPHRLVLGDIRDRNRMDQIFGRFRPGLVFHVAAHKHVTILEDNPEEAVKNNVLGTRNVAVAAIEAGAEVFVNVSTDKAADPACVMGACKFVGEMIVQSLNAMGGTRFVVVRFGNVLGSRGSVLRLFQKQVAAGGPLTVTDPRATRYFMTAGEACRLLVRSAVIGEGGRVLILDMGRPVRILDLAKGVIRQAGKVPGRDVLIRFTGLRPGEKLHEELANSYEMVSATAQPGILAARQEALPWSVLAPEIDTLAHLAAAGDAGGVRGHLFALTGQASRLAAEAAAGERVAGERVMPERRTADAVLGAPGYRSAGG